MLDIDTKQVAKPFLCDTYILMHINQASVFAFLNNLSKLCDIRQYNDKLSNINDTGVLKSRNAGSVELFFLALKIQHNRTQLF